MAFLLPSSQLNERQQYAGCSAGTEIAFAGPASGRIVLLANGPILAHIVGTMLGERPPSEAGFPEFLERDALEELARVICGNVLSDRASEAPLRFDPPRPVDAGALDPGRDAAAEVHVGIASGRADVLIYLDEPAPRL